MLLRDLCYARIKVLRAELMKEQAAPGTVLSADTKRGLMIAAGDGALRIIRLQAPGGKPMDSRDWLRGHPVTAGEVDQKEREQL